MKEDCSSSIFYHKENLPPHDKAGWEQRMLYRVFLRSDYPSCVWRYGEAQVLYFGLINEMSLYPRGALPMDLRTPCRVTIMLADGTPADDVQVSLSGVDGGFAGLVGGRGSCSVTLTSSKHRTVQVLICIAMSNAQVRSPVHVMPLVFGPLTLTQSDQVPSGDELLEFYRPLGLPLTIKPLLIREQPELAIPGKIWDSALFASELALELTLRLPTDQTCNILDLSCGTGVCGLWLAAALDTQKRNAKIILSDLTEALPVIQANIAQSASPLDVEALSLCWGNKADLQQLEAICTTRDVTAIDVVIACDLIYEAELLSVLASTLKDIATMSQRPTTIVIGYKQRGLTQAEKAGLWRTFEEACGFQVARMQHVACTSMLAEKVEADFVGVELWLLTMSD